MQVYHLPLMPLFFAEHCTEVHYIVLPGDCSIPPPHISVRLNTEFRQRNFFRTINLEKCCTAAQIQFVNMNVNIAG